MNVKTEQELNEFLTVFIEASKEGRLKKGGALSKILLNKAREIKESISQTFIEVEEYEHLELNVRYELDLRSENIAKKQIMLNKKVQEDIGRLIFVAGAFSDRLVVDNEVENHSFRVIVLNKKK